jgi:hypothetical protein
MRAYLQTLVLAMLVMRCSNNAPVTPLESMEGNCLGVIKDARGSPVKGASIFLVPEGYSPLFPNTGSDHVDSTVSSDFGRYGFTVTTPGSYTLLAKSKNLYSIRRTVRISADARVILDDEVLQEPGSLAGTVHLQGESDHRPAIILLMGTTIYVKPFDSTGTFSVAALAQGSYTMRILTAENDFAVMETTVTVSSGMQTTLRCIELHKKFVPIIDSLSVIYDPVMMRAVLTWPGIDTVKIKNYAVYCNRSENLTPIAIVNKSGTTITFDIIASPIDTFRYQISAVGNDGTEGPPAEGSPFTKSSAITLDKITHTVPLDEAPSNYYLFVDRQENICIISHKRISKLDSNGNLLGEYILSSDSIFHQYSFRYHQVRIDTAGNLYALISTSGSLSLIKLNDNMKVIQELRIDTVYNDLDYSIIVSASGAVMMNVSYSSQTFSRLYDPQFQLIDIRSVPERRHIDQSVISGDTAVGLVYNNFQEKYRIVYYDNSFNEISSPVAFDFRDNFLELFSFVPQRYSPIGSFYLGSTDLFALEYYSGEDSPPLLLFIDSRKQAIARMPYDNRYCFINGEIFFSSKGNFYSLSNTEKNIILKYSMVHALKSNSK